MAMAANSNHSHSPTTTSPSSAVGGGDGGGANSPSSRRRLQSPWAQIVRGVELESSSSAAAAPCCPTSLPPISADDSVPPENKGEAESVAPESESSDNAAASKKPVWRKPLNGVVEGTSVMGGAISWPALGESTRSTGKSSADSSSSTKPVVDGSNPISQAPVIAQTPQKPANANNNANANHGLPRQRSMKNRNASQGGFSRPVPSPPTPPPMPPPFPSNVNYGGNFVPPPVLESSIRGTRPAGNEHNHSTHSPSPRNKRNNYSGSRPRGDGQYHGARRDHDRNIPQFVPPPPGSYMPPPPPSPGSAPFISPPPMRPFPPMGFDMPPPPYLYVPALPPYMAPPPPPPMYYPIMDPPPLHALIIKQIDYYFSDSNLVKDDYLRSNMDDEGWVPLDLIAKFPRVQQLTTEIPLILESLKASLVVEVKERGDKLRRRNDWKKWVRTSSSQVSPKSGKEVLVKSPEDTLSSSINKISLNEGTSSGSGDGNGESDTKNSGLEPARSSPSLEDSSAAASSVVANGDAMPEELEALST